MDDSTLIEQIQLGSKDAFKQMFIKFYSPLCEYASQYVSDEDAEELIQELMLFIWENRNSLFVEISLKSYLFMAVKHRCLNAIKRQLYHERVHSLIYDKIKDQFENPDTYFVNELTENITKAIEELPENYRETFKLSRFGEQSNPQIAEALGVSIKTVRISSGVKSRSSTDVDKNVVPHTMMVNRASRWPRRSPADMERPPCFRHGAHAYGLLSNGTMIPQARQWGKQIQKI